ncbi:MAG: T9SS type A sorting domain-containing protein [Candidatus Nomurabacteria bacterium]|nr:T9SS type A sorting domain-containing protein [Candidatus Nomurabacteria bacterium]
MKKLFITAMIICLMVSTETNAQTPYCHADTIVVHANDAQFLLSWGNIPAGFTEIQCSFSSYDSTLNQSGTAQPVTHITVPGDTLQPGINVPFVSSAGHLHSVQFNILVYYGDSLGQLLQSNSVSFTADCLPLTNVSISATHSTICSGEQTTMTATGGTTYSWQAGNYNATSIVVAPSMTTTYTVTATTGQCTGTATQTITVNQTPVLASGSNQTICSGSTTIIGASASVGTLTWAPGGAHTDSITVSAAATYTVTATNGTCSSTGTVVVGVSSAPTAIIYYSTLPICIGGSRQLTAVTGNGWTYTWLPTTGLNNPNIHNPIASPTSTTTYTLTVSNGGCVDTNHATVTVSTALAVNAIANNSVVCSGSSVNLSATGGSITYTWMPGNLSGASVNVNPTVNTTYTVSSSNGTCTSSDTLTVNVFPSFPAAVYPATGFCAGGSTLLLATGGTTYSWFPTAGLNNPNVQNPIASPVSTTTYTVTIGDGSGCTVSLPTTVTVLQASGTFTVTASPSSICAYSNTGTYITLSSNASGVNHFHGVGVVVSYGNRVYVAGLSPGDYVVYDTVYNQFGCPDVESTIIHILGIPDVSSITFTSTTTTMGQLIVNSGIYFSDSVYIITPYQTLHTPTQNILQAVFHQVSTIHVGEVIEVHYVNSGCFELVPYTGNVGIIENESKEFKIFPNPSSSDFTIELMGDNKVTISDMLGQEVQHYIANGNVVVLGSELSKGVYFVEVKNSEGIHTQKIVKQ